MFNIYFQVIKFMFQTTRFQVSMGTMGCRQKTALRTAIAVFLAIPIMSW